MPQAALVGVPGIYAPGRIANCAPQLGIRNCWGGRNRYRLRNLVLQHENVDEIAVVTLGPNVLAALGFDQLSGDANTAAGLAQAAFEYIAYTQLAPDVLHVDGTPPKCKRRVACDDRQPRTV